MATLITNVDGCFPAPLREGIWALVNNDPATNVRVKSIVTRAPVTTDGGGAGIDLVRISDMTGGTTIPVATLNPSVSISAGGCVENPDNVVVSSAPIREYHPNSWLNYGSGGGAFGITARNGFGSDIYKAGDDANLQGLSVSSTDGVALVCNSAFVQWNASFSVTVRDQVSGTSHIFVFRAAARASGLAIAAFLPVSPFIIMRIAIFDLGCEYAVGGVVAPPRMRLARIASVIGDDDARTAPIVPLNPSVTAPANVYSIAGPFAPNLYGLGQRDSMSTHQGAQLLAEQQIGVLRTMQHYVQDSAGLAFDAVEGREVYRAYDDDSAIVIRPGEGIALLAGVAGLFDNSQYWTMTVECIFEFTPASAPVGIKPSIFGSQVIRSRP